MFGDVDRVHGRFLQYAFLKVVVGRVDTVRLKWISYVMPTTLILLVR